MRVFIALDCNAQRQAFARLQHKLPTEGTTFPDSFHLTLKFLGDLSRDELETVQKRLALLRFAPFTISFDHIGYFSHNNKKHIIWAGMTRKTKMLSLQREIDGLLAPLRKPQKKYLPHVTLARVQRDNHQRLKHLMALIKPMTPLSVAVNDVRLIHSTLTPTGPLYKTLQTIPAMT